MQIKLFEVRDAGTFIPCIGIAMNEPASEAERYLLRRSGYALEQVGDGGCVLFGRMDGGEFHYDGYDWPMNPRTMRTAALYIESNWHELQSGDVICVETILGERATPKTSERLEGVL